ncbi:LAFA_0F17810g1_1 [Lachancea sp. 'fantastica']|nr:LAFA_0F17810g1_1 [Lachancea sp. 'fantastica']
MLLLTHCLLFSSAVAASAASLRGVPDAQRHLYRPLESDSTKWACLSDPSIILNYSQINDDYCDCPDGSDEPGTSACGSLSRFYCSNDGFASRFVSGFKVDDGVCDCCDCSDEKSSSPSSEYSCAQLNDEFDALVKQETDRHRRGVVALREIEGCSSLGGREDDATDAESALESIETEYSVSAEQYKACVSELAATKNVYNEKLQRDSPLMFRLEQLGIPQISSSVVEIFTQAESYSNLYHELVDILKSLQENYNENLNDDVVNQNVQKFVEYMQNNAEEGTISGSFDRTQRNQITTYLTEELPNMILQGTSHLPPAAIEGKCSMAKTLVKVKIDYCQKMYQALKNLTAIMNDVSSNYNVNFQDSGVKNAVTSYRDFLAKNAGILEPSNIPSNVMERLQDVEVLVRTVSSKLLTPSWREQNSLQSLYSGFLFKLKNAFSNKGTGLQMLKSKVGALEQNCATLRKEYRAKADQIRLLRKENSQRKDDQASDLTTQKLGELLAVVSPSCVEEKIDEYNYQICFNSQSGVIVQKEDKPGGKQVLIGRFDTHHVEPKGATDRYAGELAIKHSESDLIAHLESDLANYETELLMGNLPQINNGLSLHYNNGDRCWNGPQRSALVYFKCDEHFKIHGVQELTRCQYAFDVSGPLGCNTNFIFTAPEWLDGQNYIK